MTWNINPFQISNQLDENRGFQKYHLTGSCWHWAHVDLLADVDLHNNWLLEFSDLKYKSFSNFKSIGWKLRILEISPKLLTFWPLDLKNNRLFPYDKLYHVVKFREDRFKIVTCRQWRDKQTHNNKIDRLIYSREQKYWHPCTFFKEWTIYSRKLLK